ncbi:AAA family ATPase [bacterium]|nr:AAA family ATPase [bacterium]
MIELKSIELKNFRSWEHLIYPFKDGITLLEGKIGTGKSSIILAVKYALQGNIEGLRKSDLIREGQDDLLVKLDMLIEDRNVTILRKKSGVQLFIDSIPYHFKYNSLLDNIKNRTKFAFLFGFSSFLDLRPNERKKYIENLLPDMEFLRKTVDDYLFKMEKNIEFKIGKINLSLWESHLDFLIENLKIIENEIKDTKLKLRKAVREKNQISKKSSFDLDNIQNKIEKLKLEKQKIEEKLSGLNKEKLKKSKSLESIVVFEKRYDFIKNKIEELKKNLKNVEISIKFEKCKWCGQEIKDFNYIKEKKNELELELKEKMIVLKDLTKKLSKFSSKSVENEIKDLDELIKSNEKVKYEIQLQINDLQAELNFYRTEMENKQKIFDVIEIYKKQLETLKEKKEHIESEISKTKRMYEIKQNSLNILDKLLAKVKDSRIELKEIVKKYYDLFISKLVFAMNAFSEGKITVDENLIFRYNGRKYEKLSSGQKQLMKISASLALAYFAHSVDVIAIDETFDVNLDSEAQEKLAQMLANLKTIFKKIIIISHNSDLKNVIKFDNIQHVDLIDEKSHLEEIHEI